MLSTGAERAAEDARGVARARGVRARHHRPEKVLPTIRSRTQHYEFALYTVDELAGHLVDVCAKEGIAADPDALSSHRARRRRIDARLAVAARPGDRARRASTSSR